MIIGRRPVPFCMNRFNATRLDAMETRLKAMVEAANTIKPSLDRFYGSLNDEQKARFNKLDRKLASSD